MWLHIVFPLQHHIIDMITYQGIRLILYIIYINIQIVPQYLGSLGKEATLQHNQNEGTHLVHNICLGELSANSA